MTSAGFNRRMRKTACPVVWKEHGAKSPCSHPITGGESAEVGCRTRFPYSGARGNGGSAASCGEPRPSVPSMGMNLSFERK